MREKSTENTVWKREGRHGEREGAHTSFVPMKYGFIVMFYSDHNFGREMLREESTSARAPPPPPPSLPPPRSSQGRCASLGFTFHPDGQLGCFPPLPPSPVSSGPFFSSAPSLSTAFALPLAASSTRKERRVTLLLFHVGGRGGGGGKHA